MTTTPAVLLYILINRLLTTGPPIALITVKLSGGQTAMQGEGKGTGISIFAIKDTSQKENLIWVNRTNVALVNFLSYIKP